MERRLLKTAGTDGEWRCNGRPHCSELLACIASFQPRRCSVSTLILASEQAQGPLSTGFLPSRSGLGFPNRFAPTPLLRWSVPSWWPRWWAGREVAIGDASRGLCGGMTATARDLYEAGLSAPRLVAPREGDPLYSWLVRRSLVSFGLPLGPLQYYVRMLLRDGPGTLASTGIGAWNRRAWKAIEGDLQAGRPCPIGLVQVRSANPWRLGENHQVLVWGAQLSGDVVRMQIYDPNVPDDDDQVVEFCTSSGRVRSSSNRVRGFFKAPYRPPESVAALHSATSMSWRAPELREEDVNG